MSERKHVLVACTGSVASVNIPKLIKALLESEIEIDVEVMATEHSLHFFDPAELNVKVHTEKDEWLWQKMLDPVLHIELRRWADLMVIAPLDANTLAKLANGICDNLITCVVRAWDLQRPLLFAPAMNTHMYYHPLTQEHRSKLSSFGYREIPSITKTLACGDTGFGGMAEVETIVRSIEETITKMTNKQ